MNNKTVLLILSALATFSLSAHAAKPVVDRCQAAVLFNPLNADFENQGLVTEEVAMTPETLIESYKAGLFPWEDLGDGRFGWYFPQQRGVLVFDEFHLSRSMKKFMRKVDRDGLYTVTFNQSFPEVIRASQEQVRTRASGETGTWISDSFVEQYTALHEMGAAHSVEVWNQQGELVGGLYGVFVDGMFAGESMFTRESNTSKLALYHLAQRLSENGHRFMDIQMVTTVTGSLGGRMISAQEFLQLKEEARELDNPF